MGSDTAWLTIFFAEFTPVALRDLALGELIDAGVYGIAAPPEVARDSSDIYVRANNLACLAI